MSSGGAGGEQPLAKKKKEKNNDKGTFRRMVLHVGGNWNNGSNVSPVYANGNNGPGNSNINIGARQIL
jgi:hypothetical protein